MLAVGQKAPDFTATTHRNAQFRLSDHQGNHIVLWFYPMAATPG